jgi:ABC-type sugar transport system permease subunit
MIGQIRKGRWIPWAFLAPYLLVTAIFLVWPLVVSLRLSMHQTFGPGFEVWIGLDNFRFLLGDPLFWKALRNTTVFAAFSVFLQLPLSLGLAILLNRPRLRGRTLFRLIFFAPSLVGLVFVGVLFSLLFEKRTGVLNRVLAAGIPGFDIEFPWLESHVMAALVIAALWLYVGFNMVYFLAALQNVPEELVEAAKLDGASPRQVFRHVVLPEILPVASFVVLLSLLGSFQLFELPFILLNGAGPDNQGLTLVMYLYNMGFVTGDLGYASAIGWFLALMLMAFALGQRWLVQRSEY